MSTSSPQTDRLFQNYQWCVTTFGADSQPSVRRPYPIEKEQFLLPDFKPEFYRWPLIVEQKTWADYDAFVAVYRAAIAYHGLDVDMDKLARTIDEGVRRRALKLGATARTSLVPQTPVTPVAGSTKPNAAD